MSRDKGQRTSKGMVGAIFSLITKMSIKGRTVSKRHESGSRYDLPSCIEVVKFFFLKTIQTSLKQCFK